MVEENLQKLESKVSFNVGGKKFDTTKETLLRFEDSYFMAMLGDGRWKVCVSWTSMSPQMTSYVVITRGDRRRHLTS